VFTKLYKEFEMKKFMKWTGISLGGLIGVILLAGLVLRFVGMRKLTQSYSGIQVETMNIPGDPDAVARGKHVATIWGCAKCHGKDLGGTVLIDNPFLGTIPSSNLTAGHGGVGGSYTDADWIRAIRHSLKPDDLPVLFMNNYSVLSDQDLGDLIAYLKQIPPVDSDHPAMEFGPILPIVPAVGFLSPAAEGIDHSAPRPAAPLSGATAEYGKYLSTICVECHGTYLPGKLEDWNREEFIHALQTGALPDGKPFGSGMKTYSEMNDTELTALWLYFQSLQSQASQD
jgi:cytochrome c553